MKQEIIQSYIRQSMQNNIYNLIKNRTIQYIKLNNNNTVIMRITRSSKNLKPVDPHLKQQSQLRMKVKLLQQQVLMLQKSNLNIFIPISQHPVHQSIDYQAIITKLRQQILQMQQQSSMLKNNVKRLERQKEQIKNKYQKEIKQYNSKIKQLYAIRQQMEIEIADLQQKYEEQKYKCCQLDKNLIQKNVELKFVHEDLHQQRIKKSNIEKQLKDLKHKISQVIYGTRIYRSIEVKCICLEKIQYDGLKDKIAELQAQIRAMIQANRREKIILGTTKSDIGQEIVRLKKNIDLQLGIKGNSKHSEQFLKIYKSTQDLFTQLINKCKIQIN